MISKEFILRTCNLPAVPVVAFKVLRLIDDRNATLDDIHKAMMADQALAAWIPKIANFAFYGVRQNVDTISEAITIIGFNTVKIIALAASIREAYKRFGIIELKTVH